MMKFAFLLALAVTATAAPSALTFMQDSSTSRIIGGVATTIEQAPYQVSLAAFAIHTCGGTIISDTWVLTAARCLLFPVGWYTIRAGSTSPVDGGSVHPIDDTIIHENYGYNSFLVPLNDLALIKVQIPFTIDLTRTAIPLFNAGEQTLTGSSALATGWGVTQHGGHRPAALQVMTIPIVSKRSCDIVYERVGGIPERQICAGLAQGTIGLCQGDFGGPLAISGRLAGIGSWNNGCGVSGFPGVYTEVASYRRWIFQHTGI